MAERGDTRIEVWIAGISEAGLSALQEKICDLLVAEGYGCLDDGDGDVLSVIAAFPTPMPDAEAFVADMNARGASNFLIPTVLSPASGGDRG